MIIADLSTSIHGLAGRSGAADWLIAVAGQDLIYLAVPLLAILWFRPPALHAGLAAGVGALLALAAAVALGSLHPEARPFVAGNFEPLFPHAADGSFPSDHLAVLGAITAGSWLGWRPLGFAAAGLSIVVAFARVSAGVHYVEDVAIGFVVGVAAALLVWYCLIPATPVLTRIDQVLQRNRLRPRCEPAA